ncbi:hypothetical protein [Marinobacter sp.]|uniref:hypothetical protein n=1 Tax=Marinobacter sp. TaxID=50741 RepID=UPI0035695CE3
MDSTQKAPSYAPLPDSLSKILELYDSLPPPTTLLTEGRFYGHSIGPTWLVAMGWPLLNFGAMAGWKGKHFYEGGHVLNIVERKAVESEILPISSSILPYTKGHGNALRLSYPSDSPFPWNRITDELRPLSDGRYLGVTTLDMPLMKRLPYPFVLTPA